MTDFRASGQRGANIGLTVAVTRLGQPIDLTLGGTELTVTGKLKTSDAAVVFQKTYLQAGGGVGITLDGTVPANNVALVDIPATEPGVLALTKTSYVLCDALLKEPNGRKTVVAHGVVKVRVGPGSP